MTATILINRALGETRVALLENGSAAELYIERDDDLGLVGNIYKARVVRVLPGMQASFVDIGLDRAAFLYVDDIYTPGREREPEPEPDPEPSSESTPESSPEALPKPARLQDDLRTGSGPSTGEMTADVTLPAERRFRHRNSEDRPSITELIREGQEILCQVSKDPLGSKGARITTYISLAGRYVAFLPSLKHIGVSRRITDDAERRRLKSTIESFRKPGEGGFIARTVSAGLPPEKLREDMDFVRSLWSDIQVRAESVSTPALVQADLDLVLRSARDLFSGEVEGLVVDQEREAQRIRDLFAKVAPHLAERVEFFEGPAPIFDHYGVEQELERAMCRKIGLKSGASIVIDEAEALTAIDVNTGSFVGSRNLEATILRTNLEAVHEIVTQLRLRNLGGIIIIDFIDMELPESRQRVYQAFSEELKKDRAKTHVLAMSGLGLVEMTRKRVRPSLGKILTEPCPYCEGRARIRSKQTICHEIYREILRKVASRSGGPVVVNAMPEVAATLTDDEAERLIELESSISRSIVVEASSELHQEDFQVSIRGHSERSDL